ncbi:MAG: DNA methyltransferase [Gammaproteobacteria bacterium]|nr:DNA methyltransferase [Gammaproteobacteria bacterium]
MDNTKEKLMHTASIGTSYNLSRQHQFELVNQKSNREWGTFKDSLRAPVHRWFTYPAGFSYKAVHCSLEKHQIRRGMLVYDPFAGTGTTNLAAKCLGIDSCGVEAHPLISQIARTKLNWKVNENDIAHEVEQISRAIDKEKSVAVNAMPELVRKCYDKGTLDELIAIRDLIGRTESEEVRRFLELALLNTLRQVSSVETGWPYIAPNKPLRKITRRSAVVVFEEQVAKMIGDVLQIRRYSQDWRNTKADIYQADAREATIPDNSVDHVFTSPPYLNNYDYADRTRLEMYFMGLAKSWADITKGVRDKLMTSATTQIKGDNYCISEGLQEDCPEVSSFLQTAIEELGELRCKKSGKKSYDRMVGGYFNDMYLVLKDVSRVMKSDRTAIFILGDSAPYGVHIPTDELVGKIALGVGFSHYEITVLRERGGKWQNNPQRHNVALREAIVTVRK